MMQSMQSDKLHYRRADIFLVDKEYRAITPIKPIQDINTALITLTVGGILIVQPNFDFSASRPAINTWDAIRAACEHDAFYWLMKNGFLSKDYREQIDYHFYNRLLEDGMLPHRALYWWRAVRLAGGLVLDSAPPPVLIAPPNKQAFVPVERSVHFPYLPI